MTTDLVPVNQDAILQALGINSRDPKAQAAVLVCQRYDLDPLLKHLEIVKSNIYITRDGFLHVAHRSGFFDGMELVDEGETPTYYWAKVAVFRKDMTRPFVCLARCKKDERIFGDPWDMAVTRAERRALKRAFDVAGLPSEGDYGEIPDLISEPARPATALTAPKAPVVLEEPPLPDDDDFSLPLEAANKPERPPADSRPSSKLIYTQATRAGLTRDQVHAIVGHVTSFESESTSDLDIKQANDVLRIIRDIKIGTTQLVPSGEGFIVQEATS